MKYKVISPANNTTVKRNTSEMFCRIVDANNEVKRLNTLYENGAYIEVVSDE